jgi:hypothetical protein
MGRADLCLVDFGFCIQMPTAISAVPTLEGLVIGSDGRCCGLDNEIKSDEVQKIFPIDQPGAKLAYALIGEVKFGQSDVGTLFDFGIEIVCSLQHIGLPEGPRQYMGRLAVDLRKKFNVARGILKLEPPEGSQTTVVVGGFYGETQRLGYIALTHGPCRTEEETYDFPPGGSFPFGSIKLIELMRNGDPRFAKYAQPSRIGMKSLRDGIERVRQDILIHYDPEASKVDEKACSHIGGRVQIATVTLTDGFRWVPGFEPAGFTLP